MVKLTFVALITVIIGVTAFGQTTVLTFSAEPPTVHLAPGETAAFQVIAANGSAYTADNLAVTVAAPAGLTVAPGTRNIAKIAPFTRGRLEFSVTATSDVAPGKYTITATCLYTYCTDVNCFQLEDSVNVPVVVGAAGVGPVKTITAQKGLPAWVIPGVGLLLLGGGIGLWLRGVHWPLYFVLFLFVVGGFTYGIHLGQHKQAQGIAAVLCTSCVGIEAVQHTSPHLSAAANAALEKIDTDITLIVFYAPWCHTCPYAEAMVKEAAAANPHIKYRFIDVSEERALAVKSGVIRNQRTIVPAILRTDTDTVIFGIRNLEPRLLQLLGVGK